MREIQLRDAKASLSAVVDDAVRGEPAIITRHGKREAVILSFRGMGAIVPGAILRAVADGRADLPGRSAGARSDADAHGRPLIARVSGRHQCHFRRRAGSARPA